nr:CMF_HP1_G0046270.mRNA.1.CDS.1 [Saccharomyces cerevisiae]
MGYFDDNGNLGYKQFIPIINLLSPFFISRSFNDYTLPPNIRKQYQNNNKIWLQEMDSKWKMNGHQLQYDQREVKVSVHHRNHCTQNISTVKDFLQIYSDIYDDDKVYKCFLYNTIFTKNPLSHESIYREIPRVDSHLTASWIVPSTSGPVIFRGTHRGSFEVSEIWQTYQVGLHQQRGLKHLRDILSDFSHV